MSETQNEVMGMIEMVSKQHHPNASKEQAVAALMAEDSPFASYWWDRYRKAQPDALVTPERVEKAAPVAGGERAEVLSATMWETVEKNAQEAGISVTEAWERFKSTSDGAVLLSAYSDAVRGA